MNKSINLLPKTDPGVTTTLEHFAILRYIAIILMSFVVICSLVLFLLIKFSPLPVLREQENKLLLTMAPYDTSVAKLFLYSDRMTQANTILSTRQRYDTHIDEVISLIPADVSIQSYTIEEKNVDVTVISSSLLSLNTLLSRLEQHMTEKKIATMTMNSLTKQAKTGDYTLSITLKLI